MTVAAATADWTSPVLARNATGQALTTITRGLYADHRNGLITTGQPETSPTLAHLEPENEPTVAHFVDCGDDSRWTKQHADSGAPAGDGDGGRRYITATVAKVVDGSWKVTDFAIQDPGTC